MNLRELEYLVAVDEECHFNGIEESYNIIPERLMQIKRLRRMTHAKIPH